MVLQMHIDICFGLQNSQDGWDSLWQEQFSTVTSLWILGRILKTLHNMQLTITTTPWRNLRRRSWGRWTCQPPS